FMAIFTIFLVIYSRSGRYFHCSGVYTHVPDDTSAAPVDILTFRSIFPLLRLILKEGGEMKVQKVIVEEKPYPLYILLDKKFRACQLKCVSCSKYFNTRSFKRS